MTLSHPPGDTARVVQRCLSPKSALGSLDVLYSFSKSTVRDTSHFSRRRHGCYPNKARSPVEPTLRHTQGGLLRGRGAFRAGIVLRMRRRLPRLCSSK
jgi:hypothetical protein